MPPTWISPLRMELKKECLFPDDLYRHSAGSVLHTQSFDDPEQTENYTRYPKA